MITWSEIIEQERKKEYFIKLNSFLNEEYRNYTVFPNKEDIFSAFKLTPLDKTRVVIIGQDPYHGEKQAHGLAFSVNEGSKIPPSLDNIFKEISSDLKMPKPKTGFLEKWAKQGVLLLNVVLTVRAGEPNSHKNKGWEIFTDRIIKELNKSEEPMVFFLWGRNALAKEGFLTNKKHLVLKAAHPSPLSASRGFLGCKHFSIANDFLRNNNLQEIDWRL